jgi:hypothetical protein
MTYADLIRSMLLDPPLCKEIGADAKAALAARNLVISDAKPDEVQRRMNADLADYRGHAMKDLLLYMSDLLAIGDRVEAGPLPPTWQV